jgi:hypothetical protein
MRLQAYAQPAPTFYTLRLKTPTTSAPSSPPCTQAGQCLDEHEHRAIRRRSRGARRARISVGSALARVAWAGFMRAVDGIVNDGSFAALEGAASFAELNALFEHPTTGRA